MKPVPTPLGQLIQAIRSEMQPEQAMNFMRHVYSTDGWFTFPKFQETTEYVKLRGLQKGKREGKIWVPVQFFWGSAAGGRPRWKGRSFWVPSSAEKS
jgi:hypothetical protein